METAAGRTRAEDVVCGGQNLTPGKGGPAARGLCLEGGIRYERSEKMRGGWQSPSDIAARTRCGPWRRRRVFRVGMEGSWVPGMRSALRNMSLDSCQSALPREEFGPRGARMMSQRRLYV